MTLALGLAVVLAPAAFAGSPKIAKDLEGADPNSIADVIIQYRTPVTEAHHNRVRQGGGALRREFGAIKAGMYSLPVRTLGVLAADADVVYISRDRQVRGSLDYATPAVNANIAWQYGWDGSGIGIAVIDSGMDEKHPDLQRPGSKTSRVVYSQSFDKGSWTLDLNGHGTHVCRHRGGERRQRDGSHVHEDVPRGRPERQHYQPARVWTATPAGTDSSVIAAIERAIQLKAQYNIRVINLSLGHPVYESYATDPLCQAVEKAWQAGIVVVVAAGNEGRNNSFGNSGYGTVFSPANAPSAHHSGGNEDAEHDEPQVTIRLPVTVPRGPLR